jgi:NADPH-dependent 2,4-dienoyl-CoA reductase/sulfur reductase-like enzyme
MARRLVIIGGDAAGMSAAAQARRMRSAGELEIVAFERGSRTSYAACGLPYLVGGLVETPELLIARTRNSTGPTASTFGSATRSPQSIPWRRP